MKQIDYQVQNLKNVDNAYDLLLDFNKRIKLYPTEEEMKKTIEKFLELGNPIGIIDKGKLIAYYNLYCNNFETLQAYFGNLYVLSEYRRQGIAKKLVLSSIDFAKKRGFKTVLLHVAKDNKPAISLYESLNFKYTGNTKLLGIEDCYEMILLIEENNK